MDRLSFHDQISRNKLKSFLLLAIILAVLILLGYVIGKTVGQDYFFIIMIIAIIFSGFVRKTPPDFLASIMTYLAKSYQLAFPVAVR